MPRDLGPRKEVPSQRFSGLVVSLFVCLELSPGGGAVGQASRWLRGRRRCPGREGEGRAQEPPLPLPRPPLQLAQRCIASDESGVVTYPPAARSKDSSELLGA